MKKQVRVEYLVEVEVDETKFTEDFMSEFRRMFYNFVNINDHIRHIAYLAADKQLMPFTEGYGAIKDFGIKAEIIDSGSYTE